MIRTELIAPISELLERQAKRFPDKVAFSDARREITYGELNEATRNLATQLRANGLKDGGSVAIWLPNCVEWAIICLAAVRARGKAVPVSYDAKLGEVSYRLKDSESVVIVTRDERVGEFAQLDANGPVVPKTRVLLGDAGDNGLDFNALCDKPTDGIELEPDDIDVCSYIVYTSGTTGQPKGVMLSSRAMLWATAGCWAPILGYGENDRVLSPLPMFHVFSLSIAVLSPVATGASVHVMDRFSVHTCIDLLKTGKFNFVPAVPTMFHYILLEGGKYGKDLFKSIRLCTSAGAIMPASLNKQFEETFGVELIDGYGITEMSTMVTMNWPETTRTYGSCGLPVTGLAVRIINPSTGIDVDFGEEGELICRGPTLMMGYNNKPEESGKVLRRGWYHTGDLARSDKHGFLTITGRLKEIIIRGGQNIAPAEVEETIVEMDEVEDCAVVGVPHETLGEVPDAFIVAAPGKSVDADAVKAYCANKLSSYKVPATVHVIEQIPRTGSGKIMRFKLREQVEKAQGK
ncbi:class I adenylate-forming enzyme family protein [Tepidamorphus sp. 3E244]|uniref:class I adenylate-forming enzyme family protein n=1 Tax=Tepidamorphus sp. 3E244 TaxID=3385498 RepID=UPI0038FCE7AE